MKLGDKVRTHFGEIGVIKTKALPYLNYDWWVTLNFRNQGQDRTIDEPYRESELTVLEDDRVQ
jgi:hypothetical protein